MVIIICYNEALQLRCKFGYLKNPSVAISACLHSNPLKSIRNLFIVFISDGSSIKRNRQPGLTWSEMNRFVKNRRHFNVKQSVKFHLSRMNKSLHLSRIMIIRENLDFSIRKKSFMHEKTKPPFRVNVIEFFFFKSLWWICT